MNDKKVLIQSYFSVWLCKKVTRNVWTSITFFRSIKKSGSFIASSQLNGNIIDKTGTEVLPLKVFSFVPGEYRHIYPRFQTTLFMYLYKGLLLDLVVTSISTKASGKELEGQSSVEFYRYVQEALVAKNKSWIHPRLFAVSHSML